MKTPTFLALVAVTAAAAAVIASFWRQDKSRVAGNVESANGTALRRLDSSSTPPPRPDSADAALPPPGTAAPATRPDPPVLAIADAVETLVSPNASLSEKERVWSGLRSSGQLDSVIAALQRLAAENAQEAQVRTALGEAQIQKIRVITESGGDASELPILGLQADRNFNQALALQPTNWEAQFMKASAMAHWPAEMRKGPEVIERLTALIAQQDTMPPQPDFARTFLVLSRQYDASGQPEKALQTLQLGAARFPTNSELNQALAHVTAR